MNEVTVGRQARVGVVEHHTSSPASLAVPWMSSRPTLPKPRRQDTVPRGFFSKPPSSGLWTTSDPPHEPCPGDNRLAQRP